MRHAEDARGNAASSLDPFLFLGQFGRAVIWLIGAALVTGSDHAISAIQALKGSGKTPSYAWLKRHFGPRQVSDEVYRSLGRGRAILTTVDQLDQYLYTYSPMIAGQWEYASKALIVRQGECGDQVIDYGCGQGLAGLLLHDNLGADVFRSVRSVIAVEPSEVALRRAIAVYEAIAPNALVTPINKDFDALSAGDFRPAPGDTIHLFSNVLDIDGYDHLGLLRKGLTAGRHTIVAVGHDRTAHGYSQGLERVKAAVDAGTICPAVRVHASEQEAFTCGDRRIPAVLWLCKLEVGDE